MTENPKSSGDGINGMLYHKLESIASQLNTLATKEELKDIKTSISSMVPRTEMDVRWRSSEGSMDEIRKVIETMRDEIRTDKGERSKDFDKFKDEVHAEIDTVKAKLDRLEENKLPNWLVGAISTVVGSLVVLLTVWAISQAFHVQTPIHVSPLP